MSADRPQNAGVIAPPPLIYGIPLAAGLALAHWFPRPLFPPPWPHLLGPPLTAVGLIGLPAVLAFRRAGTDPRPWKPATALVTSGPFRLSRNPMYLGMTLLYLGITVWMNTPWPLFALPVILIAMNRGVIAREEAYLDRTFGEPYRAYRARVRRWL